MHAVHYSCTVLYRSALYCTVLQYFTRTVLYCALYCRTHVPPTLSSLLLLDAAQTGWSFFGRSWLDWISFLPVAIPRMLQYAWKSFGPLCASGTSTIREISGGRTRRRWRTLSLGFHAHIGQFVRLPLYGAREACTSKFGSEKYGQTADDDDDDVDSCKFRLVDALPYSGYAASAVPVMLHCCSSPPSSRMMSLPH